MNFKPIPSLALVVALLLASTKAFGWGVEGHEIVAGVALRELTPQARRQVAQILGGEGVLVGRSNWADEIREGRRETARWHFVDIPLQAPGFVPRRDCAYGDCVVAQIENDLKVLRKRRQNGVARAQALLFLIHFVADVHQPLHAENNGDKGGNDVRVQIGRKRASLHRVWDVDVVEVLGPDPDAAAQNIERDITPEQRQAWSRGTPAGWANEAHAIARDQIYPTLQGARELRLPRDYAWREAGVARQQLAKAGVRLAWLLNTTLK